MKKTYSFLLGGLLAVTTFASQAQSVNSTSIAPVASATASSGLLAPEPTAAPARQAATALATAPAASNAEAAAVAPEQHPAEQEANCQPQQPAKPAKVSKGVWIAIGIGVLLAVVRIAAAS